jgi:hypothetical protein
MSLLSEPPPGRFLQKQGREKGGTSNVSISNGRGASMIAEPPLRHGANSIRRLSRLDMFSQCFADAACKGETQLKIEHDHPAV